MSGTRTNGARSGRLLAFGTTGFAASVALLMILSPAVAGIQTHVVLAPPYKHSASSANYYSSVSGCASAKTTKALWNAKTGTVTFADSTSARTCKGGVAGVGSSGSAYTTTGIEVAIPFTVSSSGAHSISSSLTVTIASIAALTTGGCPKPNVAYPQAMNSYAYAECYAANELSFYASAQVVDLNNGSWYGNYSYASAYNYSYWENYTYCYNYGSPACSNFTGGASYMYGYGYNYMAGAPWTFNGANSLTLWTNGTSMVRGHHYVLLLSVSDDKEAYAYQINELGFWAASASASINMATLGNGARLNSITIV